MVNEIFVFYYEYKSKLLSAIQKTVFYVRISENGCGGGEAHPPSQKKMCSWFVG